MTLKQYMKEWWQRYGGTIALLAAVASTVYIGFGLVAPNQGDIAWYQWIIHDWAAGKLPYLMHPVEYPPYALIIFLIPWWLGDASYLFHFLVLACALDIGIKALLLYAAWRNRGSPRAYLPLIFYSLAVPLISYFYLQRFDLWPAAVALAALILFSRKKYLFSGVLLSVATGIKLYPAVFVLPLLAIAYRDKKWKPFMAGLAIGILPIIIASFFLPWWRFAEFQGARGLQAESLYASVIWFVHFFASLNLAWIRTTAWFEVQGPLPSAIVDWARVLFGVSVLASTWVAVRAGLRLKAGEFSAGRLARIALVPLLSFMVFNLVFSPQYTIWVIPVAALAALEGSLWPVLLVLASAALIRFFYPVADYFSHGLTLPETAALLGRNLLLAAAWIWLMIEQSHVERRS